MANNILNTRIKHKYDSEANWKSKNPILLDGELAFSRDKNNKYKVGDGTSKWSDLSYSIDDILAAYLAKTGGTVTGDVTFDSTLYSKDVTGSSKNGIILLPRVLYQTIDSTHTNEIYLKELCKWICTNYPNCQSRIFIGTANPNTQGAIIIHIYDTTVVKDGYPQYASGIYVTLQNFYTFGFNAYEFYYKNISLNGHTHSISQISDISNASVKTATSALAAVRADKLTTTRNIKVSGGAISNNGANFDGSGNISIPIDSVKESYLSWGGKNFSGDFGCIDAAMVPDLGANRLAFGKPAGITIEYSRDSGETWLDYKATDGQKSAILSTGGFGFAIGKSDSTNMANEKCMLRVTLDTDKIPVYTVFNKFALYVSTNGSVGCYCTIDASLESAPNTFVSFADKVQISGWSGWNIINVTNLTSYGNTPSRQYGLIRFTFGCTSRSDGKYFGLQVFRIMGFGGVGWTTPSNMAQNGSIYSYDSNQNVTFPAAVVASNFNGSLNGNARTTTVLKDSHKINGTSFNGSADITTVNWGTSRNITIGNAKKSVNGSADVSWSLNEIGAAASGHNHNNVTTSTSGFMSTNDKSNLDTLVKYFDDSVTITKDDFLKMITKIEKDDLPDIDIIE